MLIIEDIAIVIGREELPFEDALRDELAPAIAAGSDARVAGFAWAPHGGGEGYEAVTYTLVDDIPALLRHQARLAFGDLAELWASFEARLHDLVSTVHDLAGWSTLASRSLADVADVDHEPSLFRLDTFTVEGATREVVGALEKQAAAAPASDLLSIEACYSPLLGDLSTPQASVLSAVRSLDALRTALAEPDPVQPWPGTPVVEGATSCQTRLLRTTAWSPLG